MILAILGLTFFNFGATLAIFDQKVCIKTISTYLKLLLEPFFVMESTFSIEKFPRFAVGFRWKDQDASRARIFSWSGRPCDLRGVWRHVWKSMLKRCKLGDLGDSKNRGMCK